VSFLSLPSKYSPTRCNFKHRHFMRDLRFSYDPIPVHVGFVIERFLLWQVFLYQYHSINIPFTTQNVLRRVQSLFQSELSTDCDLVHLLSNSSIFGFP
jgi:hypothetical protein